MKNKLIISALITLASSIVFGQCNDLSVNTTIFSQTGLTTCGSGDDFSSSSTCGSSYMGGEDFVIEYSPDVSGCINITLSNTLTWTGVFLTSDCPNNGGATCLGSNTNSGGNPSLTGINVTVGQIYYITISTFPAPNCTPFDIAITACPPPPSNDECSGAISVPVNPDFLCGSITPGSIASATNSPQPNGCYGTANDDVWYSFTATNSTHTIDLLNVSGSTTDLYHSVYNNNCGALGTALVCSDPNNSTVTGLTPGNSYFVRIYSYSSSTGATTNFDLCIGTPPPPPPNDECSSAINVPVNPDLLCGSITPGSIASATNSPQPNGCYGTANDDVWYSFTATNSTHTIDLLNVSGSTTDLYHSVYNNNCGALGTALECSDPNSSIVTGLTPGNTYLVRVYSWSSSSGATTSFNLCIGTPPPPPDNVNCANMSPICSGSAIAFTASSGGGTAPPGNNYDCLYSQPNPTWFYLEIDNSGSLSIDITAGSDIDYAIWGPFTDLATAQSNCSNLAMPKDCSYSASEIEQANISNVNSGEVYVLLITNYSNVIQSVFVNEAASNTASTDCSIVPLPVELISFDAKAIGQEVQLTWVTASERDCDYFEIQRSADGKVWETIGFKKGNGNTTQLTNYSFYDKKPLKGVSYYRLKQVDFNGSLEFLPIKSVHFLNLSDIIQLHPNPAKDWVSITAYGTKVMELLVRSSNGKEIQRIVDINNNKASINCNELAAGIYFIEILTTDNQRHHQKLVIQ